MTKIVVVRARRTLRDGRRMLQIVCPQCQHRHWIPDSHTGFCPRRHTAFEITNGDEK